MHQIYQRWSLFFRTPFPKNISTGLLLDNEERKNRKTKSLAFMVRDGLKIM